MVLVGVLLLVAKMAELGPFANLSWWWVLSPFGLAVLWWHFADTSGWTQRRVMDKMERRKTERRQRQMESLGLDPKRERQATRAREDAARLASADPTQAEHPLADRKPTPEQRDPRP